MPERVSHLRETLQQLVEAWEDEVVEFKEATNDFDTSKIGQYFSALANEANLRGQERAWLVFGVRDSSREIVGTNYRPQRDRLEGLKKQVSDGSGSSFREIHELITEAGRVLLFEVPAAPPGLPIGWNGHYFARAGEHLVALSDAKRDAIRNQTVETDWTAAVVPDATVEHLDPSALVRARQGFAERNTARIPADDIERWDDSTFLAKARLTRDGVITRAAILLLGAATSTHLLSPHPAQMTWKLVGQEQANEHFRLPFLLTATALSRRIRNLQIRLMPPNELIYREISKYDERSILEALYNCIAHQDYSRNSRIVVTEYVDRLVFESVGEFFDGTPLDYALDERTPRKYRNPFLVEAMTELNLIDQMGYGIHRMVQDQVRRFLPLPDYDLRNEQEVKLTIPGAVIDEAYSKLLMVRTDLPLGDVLALDRVQKNLPIADDAVRRLRRSNLIEGRKPRLHVSASVADAIDARAEYMQTRALDDEHYARLVVEYLETFGQGSRREIDTFLWNKLPDSLGDVQKASKIHNLLTKLRKSGVIVSIGPKRTARWQLNSTD